MITDTTGSMGARGRPWLALALLVPVPSLAVLAAMWWWPGSAFGQAVFGLSKLWIVGLPVVWHRWVERRPLSASPARHGGWGAAVASGLAVALVLFGAFLALRHLGWIDSAGVRARAELTGLASRSVFLATAAYWITFNSLAEEYVWRWFVFQQCERLWGGRLAVLASAAGFTAHHVFALAAQFDWRITGLASAGVFAGGLIWSALYRSCRSIWPCWVSHALVDIPVFGAGWLLVFG